MILCEKCGGQILEKNESNTNNLPICGCWVTLEPYYSAKDMEDFAEWMSLKEHSYHPKAKMWTYGMANRKTTSQLRELWEKERREK